MNVQKISEAFRRLSVEIITCLVSCRACARQAFVVSLALRRIESEGETVFVTNASFALFARPLYELVFGKLNGVLRCTPSRFVG